MSIFMSGIVKKNLPVLPAQCRAARALLDWSQTVLAQKAAVAKQTVADFERGARTPYPRTLADIRRALEAEGIEFSNGNAPGVRVRPRTS